MDDILIVEDDTLLRDGIAYALGKAGYKSKEAGTLADAGKYLNQKFRLLILDLNLPDGDGRTFLRQLRVTGEIPVLVLTARNSEEDIVESFDLGCDDYLTKPFSTAVLLKHIGAILKRSNKSNRDIYYQGNLIYDFSRKQLLMDRRDVDLTATECRLLELFLKNKNQVLTREVILRHVWDAYENYVDEKALNVNIRRLRKKVETDAAAPVRILTVFGIGYKWSDAND